MRGAIVEAISRPFYVKHKWRGLATITFTTSLNESEPSRVRHRPDRTMRVGDEVAMVGEMADGDQLACKPGAFVVQSVWSDVLASRMHAVVVGDGAPVVLVHGFGVSGAYMLPLARALAASFSAFVPDLPGQGKSTSLRGQVGVTQLALALGAWVEAEGLTRPAFVANSMGCQVVTELAARRPAQVGPMVLIGPTIDPARRAARRQLVSALRAAAREPFSLIALAARDERSAGARALLSTARAVLADRIEDRLPLIEQRTLVVYGDKDSFVGREWAERVATLLPRGRLRIVSGEPHAVHYTQPELVARLVRELVIEEGQHAGCQLRRRLEHGNVSATKVRQPDVDHGLAPLFRNSERHEAVALSPDEQRRRANGRKLLSQIAARDERDSAGDVERPRPHGVNSEHR
jgi:2-hydroxy-6-oxonona-2,4-dienedioate hydrolase